MNFNARSIRKILIAAFLFFITSEFLHQPVAAQVLNIEQFRTDADTSNVWHGSLSFGFSASHKNKSTIQLNNRTNLTYLSENHVYMLINNLTFLRVEDELASEGYVHLRSTLNRRNRFSPEIFTQFQYSQDWGLLRRYLAGAGFRYDLIRGDEFTAGITTGGMYEHEVWKPEDGTRSEYNRFKSTNSLLMRGNLAESTSVVVIGYYQAVPSDFFNPRITLDAELRFQISRFTQFGLRFSTTYDANPAAGVTNWIYTFTNNVTFLF